MDKLGKIDDNELSFITHEEAKNYVQVLEEKSIASGKRRHFLEDIPGSGD